VEKKDGALDEEEDRVILLLRRVIRSRDLNVNKSRLCSVEGGRRLRCQQC